MQTTGKRDQRGFGTAVVFLAGKQRMSGRKELQRALAPRFLVTASERVKLFPDRWLNDRQRNRAAGDHGFDRANGASVLEAARRTLLWHRLGALDQRVLRGVLRNPVADGEHIDALFGAYAGDRNVDRIDEL